MINDRIYKIFGEYAPSPSYAFDNADSDTNDHPSDDIVKKNKKQVKRKIPFNLDTDEIRKYKYRSSDPSE